MSEEYGNDFVTLIDEDGNEVEFEHIDTVEYEGVTYLAFIPAELSVEDVLFMLHAVEDNITAAAVTAARVFVSFIFYRPFRIRLRWIPPRRSARERSFPLRKQLWMQPRRCLIRLYQA